MKIRGHTLKYMSPWNRANQMFKNQYQTNISIYIKESIIEILSQKHKEITFSKYELDILNQWKENLNANKQTYNNYIKPTVQEYKKFVLYVYNHYIDEKNKGNITLENANGFRECNMFIELLNNYGPLDDEMSQLQKQCIDHAIEMFGMLKTQMFTNTTMNNNNNNRNSNYSYNNNNQNMKKENNNNKMEVPQGNYNPKKKGIRLKFGSKQSKEEQDVNTGPRTSKVTDIPGEHNKKCFTFLKNNKQNFNVPVQNKTIEYYTLLDHIKKVNKESMSSLRKGRLQEANNYILDSLEYLNYINHS